MLNFDYYTPTRVVFGRNTEAETGKLIREQKCQKVLVHYGSGSVVRSGLLERIYASLKAEGIQYVSLGGVVPNPRLSKVREGIALGQKEGVDFILAVGGGSVIDSAKAIGYGMTNEGDVWDFYAKKRTAKACLPVGAVLTIAAAGSEMSNSSVITNEDGLIKRGYSSNYSRCRFAVLNPELTYTLPDYQTQSGCVDIMMHTLERYLNHGTNMEITDGISEALLRTVIKNAQLLKKEPENYEARAEVMWAGSLSHNGLTGCGTDGGDFASHQLEHELSGMFDVTHGAGLSAVWGSWARYVYKERPDRFANLAVRVLRVSKKDSEEATALAGIEAMEDFFRSIGMPVTLRELKVEPTKEQILKLAEKCSFGNTRTIGVVKKLGREDMAAIYRMAKG
ncbi:iron-containing alcohol dehydrogenase [Lachnospiraceae bacterium WCA-9-b2]|jgi:alcohol dehydrogenase YqhD (iron-dependent ADH family)|uniref:Iron-containing alcohol dehydrogenase n=1 Tax=Sporofaciens musculi TaxID=2681861 RepID=A0A7X3SKF1_9FIRM|nr:iron-containing alcohol dehydrogenase [Sporofaciens musculi]MXP77306.1 iron-containing alcohol dehydrogenase [Sporofaciens musculi]